MKIQSCRFCFLPLLLGLILLSACSGNKRTIELEESGMFSQKIKISTLPTKAKIIINEQEIGTSPVSYKIAHEDNRMLNIKAIPLYPNQYTQNIYLMVPPIPKTMTIYMNHFPEDYERNKEKEFVPPQKPEPEIIVQTDIDTVYVEKTTTETVVLSLPAIYFDTDSYQIKAQESSKLQELLGILNTRQDTDLDIYGFADVRASEKYNLELTLNRAKSVRDYLVEHGIDEGRLHVYGHGKVPKVSSEGTDMELSESRKVLFLLRKKQTEN